MIKLVKLLATMFAALVALVIAFAAGWGTCTAWVVLMLQRNNNHTRRTSRVSYRDFYERDRAV